jgi:hypothetical protein
MSILILSTQDDYIKKQNICDYFSDLNIKCMHEFLFKIISNNINKTIKTYDIIYVDVKKDNYGENALDPSYYLNIIINNMNEKAILIFYTDLMHIIKTIINLNLNGKTRDIIKCTEGDIYVVSRTSIYLQNIKVILDHAISEHKSVLTFIRLIITYIFDIKPTIAPDIPDSQPNNMTHRTKILMGLGIMFMALLFLFALWLWRRKIYNYFKSFRKNHNINSE